MNFQVLGDDTRRQQYDLLGSAGYDAQQQGGRDSPWGSQGFSAHMDPEDLFRKIFEEFSGGTAGKHSQSYQDFRDFAPQEVIILIK